MNNRVINNLQEILCNRVVTPDDFNEVLELVHGSDLENEILKFKPGNDAIWDSIYIN